MLLDTYQARGGKELRHDGIGAVAVTKAGMAHSVSSGLSACKIAALMSPKVLQSMFGAGHARQESVRKTKNGKTDKKKASWTECWHVVGNIRIDGRMRRYDFTVAKISGHFELYDLKLK